MQIDKSCIQGYMSIKALAFAENVLAFSDATDEQIRLAERILESAGVFQYLECKRDAETEAADG